MSFSACFKLDRFLSGLVEPCSHSTAFRPLLISTVRWIQGLIQTFNIVKGFLLGLPTSRSASASYAREV